MKYLKKLFEYYSSKLYSKIDFNPNMIRRISMSDETQDIISNYFLSKNLKLDTNYLGININKIRLSNVRTNLFTFQKTSDIPFDINQTVDLNIYTDSYKGDITMCAFVIKENKKIKYGQIYQCDDDWFIVILYIYDPDFNEDLSGVYKCDQLDGLYQLIDSI